MSTQNLINYMDIKNKILYELLNLGKLKLLIYLFKLVFFPFLISVLYVKEYIYFK